jgi:hypothetical protein
VSPILLLSDDELRIPWALLVFLLPVAARIARAVLEKLGLVKPAAAEPIRAPASERQRQREEEDEGTDLFERLARGEEPASPPLERPVLERPARMAEASLESEEEPAPLSVLGEARAEPEPGCVPEPSLEVAAASAVSLESEEEPAPLAAFDRPPELSEAAAVPLGSRRFRLARGDLGRAILYSEILGPPLAQRPAR